MAFWPCVYAKGCLADSNINRIVIQSGGRLLMFQLQSAPPTHITSGLFVRSGKTKAKLNQLSKFILQVHVSNIEPWALLA